MDHLVTKLPMMHVARAGIATMSEMEVSWTIDDVYDALDYLDACADAEWKASQDR